MGVESIVDVSLSTRNRSQVPVRSEPCSRRALDHEGTLRLATQGRASETEVVSRIKGSGPQSRPSLGRSPHAAVCRSWYESLVSTCLSIIRSARSRSLRDRARVPNLRRPMIRQMRGGEQPYHRFAVYPGRGLASEMSNRNKLQLDSRGTYHTSV